MSKPDGSPGNPARKGTSRCCALLEIPQTSLPCTCLGLKPPLIFTFRLLQNRGSALSRVLWRCESVQVSIGKPGQPPGLFWFPSMWGLGKHGTRLNQSFGVPREAPVTVCSYKAVSGKAMDLSSESFSSSQAQSCRLCQGTTLPERIYTASTTPGQSQWQQMQQKRVL